jgi:hypothetical protein
MVFKTPEEFFLAHPPVEVPDIFDPAAYIKSAPGSPRECNPQPMRTHLHPKLTN